MKFPYQHFTRGCAKTILIAVLCIAGFGLGAQPTNAAILRFDPEKNTVSRGETFVVSLLLDSEETVMNAMEGTFDYSKDTLELISVSRGESFLTLWPQEPTHDQENARVTFTGGIPGGTLAKNGVVVSMIFRAKQEGTGTLTIDETSSGVYLNDGLGTAAQLISEPATFEIINTSPFALLLFCATHPNENKWYPENTIRIRWEAKPNAEYSFEMTTDALKIPDDIVEETNGEYTMEKIADGISYFVIKEKPEGQDWGPATRYRTMTDTTPPEPFTPQTAKDLPEYEKKAILIFSTVDRASGIDHYEIKEEGESFSTATSPYIIKKARKGRTLTVQAIDAAGNIQTADITLTETTNVALEKLFSWAVILITIGLVGAMVLIAIVMKKRSLRP